MPPKNKKKKLKQTHIFNIPPPPRLPPTHSFRQALASVPAGRSESFVVTAPGGGGARFLVYLDHDKRWKRFHTTKRVYTVIYIEGEESSEDDHLLRNIHAENMLDGLLQRLLEEIRDRHSGPDTAVYSLSLTADGLEYPINTGTSELRFDMAIEDLLSNLDRVLPSHNNISLTGGFKIQVSVVDVPQAPARLPRVAGMADSMARKGVPEDWKEMNPFLLTRNVFLMPDLDRDAEFSGCCLLAAVVMGMFYNREMRANIGNKKLNNPKTREWRVLRRLDRGTRLQKQAARNLLRTLMSETVEKYGLDLELFRSCSLDLVREQIDLLGVFLNVVRDENGFRSVFRHPQEYDGTKEVVEVMLVGVFAETDGVAHAALVADRECLPRRALSLGIECLFCCQVFSKSMFPVHRCRKSERCRSCRRPAFRQGMYVDFHSASRICRTPRLEGEADHDTSLPCSRCKRRFYSDACEKAHRRFCKKDSRSCDDCGIIYKAKVGADCTIVDRHDCRERFCRNCFFSYRLDSGEEHVCKMAAPKPPDRWSKLAFFDLETYPRGKSRSHTANAAGLSFETSQGVFSEVFFYDDNLHHEEDSVVKDDVFKYDYWPKGMRRRKAGERVKTPKDLYKRLYFSSSGRGVGDGSEEDGEGGAVDDDDYDDDDDGGGYFLDREAAVSRDREAEDYQEEDGDALLWEDPWRSLKRKAAEPDGSDGDSEDEEEDDEDGREPRGKKAIEKLLDFMLQERFYNYTFIAHAASRFDSLLMLRGLLKRNIRARPLFDGNKALLITIPVLKMRLVDSYRYIKVPLAKFSDRFPHMKVDMRPNSSLKKGTFPYMMNKEEHYDYNGPFPDESFFLDAFSRDSDRATFEAFRDGWPEGEPWNFKQQLHAYLEQDVRVLRAGCLEFMKEFFVFQEELQEEVPPRDREYFHPFTQPYFTNSSFVHALWRHFAMPPDTVFLVKNQKNARKSSKHELEWLSYLNSKEGQPFIRSALNHPEGQAMVGSYFVDGYTRPEDAEDGVGVVYEFLGCVVHYHGAEDPDCEFNEDVTAGDKNPFGVTCESAYQAWRKKKRFLTRNCGVRVVELWECEYLEQKKTDGELADFLKNDYYAHCRPEERLRLRTGLRGGRVETFRLLFESEQAKGRKLLYIDKNSLYPAVAVLKRFPVGLPEILIGKAAEAVSVTENGFFLPSGREILGLAQVTVRPPDSLFLPVLPTVAGGKLKFGLCRTCLHTMPKGLCTHDDRDRDITDVWTLPEICHAVKCGYSVVKVWEIFAYTESEFVFRDFYTRLARMKLEAEGFPDDVGDKDAYVAELNSSMPGLGLKKENISSNWPRRQFAKDTSNAALGKFSQNDDRENSMYVTSAAQVAKVRYESPDKRLIDVFPINQGLAELTYKPNDQRQGYHRNVQVIIYAYVTAHARLGMLDDMRRLMNRGAKLFYSDTDSIVFDFEDDPAALKSLEKEFNMGSKAYNAYKYETKTDIISFVSLGAKNYSFLTRGGVTVVKTRGFTLNNARARRTLNHCTMKDLLLRHLRGEVGCIDSESARMKINRRKQTVVSTTMVKKYRNNVFDKRQIIPDSESNRHVCTFPFGLRHTDFADCGQDYL